VSEIARQLAEIEGELLKSCKCGRRYDLVRTMLNVRTGKHVRMF